MIWWLTGTSRQQPIEESELKPEVVGDALMCLPRSDVSVADGDVGTVLVDTLTGLGMGRSEALDAVKAMGYTVSDVKAPEEPKAQKRGLTVLSMGDEHARAALERALLVGIQLARMDDDYAGVSDEADSFEALREKADEVEASLFGDRRRAMLDFYSRAVIVLQDRVQSEPDASKRETAGQVLSRFDDELRKLQNEMAEAMADLPTDGESVQWGDSEDRRRYYFKMGVTNSLRRSGHLKSLGSLYRFRGVNYDVEEAYQIAGEEEPLLIRAANLEFSKLIALAPADVRRLTGERRVNRIISQPES